MAKTKPDKRKKSGAARRRAAKADLSTQAFAPETAQQLLDEATSQLQTGDAAEALQTAQKLQTYLSRPTAPPLLLLPAHEVLGEIHIELGDPDAARAAFLATAALDPDGELPDAAGGGPDKFLWLAQLSDQGGAESVAWFDKGIAALRRSIAAADEETDEAARDVLHGKLANALCGVAEVYMTDLSWEADAEARCEALVTEACVVAPRSAEALQTLASVRLSQARTGDAQAALARSIELWTDLPDQHPAIPDFPTRISLARLLMEAELEDKALDVLERLIGEDDTSVEAWYLGGWCQYLIAEQRRKDDENKAKRTLKSSRDWLKNGLRLYDALEYEDNRLRDHALELVGEADKVLGPQTEDGKEDADDWEDADDDDEEDDGDDEDDDEKMNGS